MSARVEVARAVRRRVPATFLRRLARRVTRGARRLGLDSVALSGLTVRICDDAEIADLHQRHMGLSGPTDVLSFPGGDTIPGQDLPAVGDIVLSWDAVIRQSTRPDFGAHLEEASQLVIHGLAHLLGHDHATRAEARAMLRTERRMARAAGIAPPVRPYGGGA